MMSMSMSSTPSSTMSSMSMAPSSTTSSMPMSTNGMMTMQSMSMTFFTSTTTPLFSMGWTPTTQAQYTGTCIFLIVLAALFRSILAIRVHFYTLMTFIETRIHHTEIRYESYGNEKGTKYNNRQWRAKDAVLLALLDVVIAGTAYLLMIAVMTMNAGYFLSILAGVFLGSMVFGRFLGNSAAH